MLIRWPVLKNAFIETFTVMLGYKMTMYFFSWSGPNEKNIFVTFGGNARPIFKFSAQQYMWYIFRTTRTTH